MICLTSGEVKGLSRKRTVPLHLKTLSALQNEASFDKIEAWYGYR